MVLDRNHSLGYALTTTLNTIRKKFNQEIKQFNISSEQYAVLKLLYEFEELTPTKTAELLARDKANVTRIINSLTQKNLIKKDSVNKKSYKIMLNNRGKEVLEKAEKVALEFNKRIKSLINDKDYECIIEKLKTIRENF